MTARKGGPAMMATRHSSTSARGPGGESFEEAFDEAKAAMRPAWRKEPRDP